MAVDDVEDGAIGFCSCGAATSKQAGCIVFPGSSGHGLQQHVEGFTPSCSVVLVVHITRPSLPRRHDEWQ
jgi:hypothetical protein